MEGVANPTGWLGAALGDDVVQWQWPLVTLSKALPSLENGPSPIAAALMEGWVAMFVPFS